MPETTGRYLDPRDRLAAALLTNMQQRAAQLRELWEHINGLWVYEDRIYRFYHQSFKVFDLQEDTEHIVAALREIAPEGCGFCEFFREIIDAGTGREFRDEDNEHWVERTGPIVQAFLHARYFLEMAVKCGAELSEPPKVLPSGWAALVCLYGIR